MADDVNQDPPITAAEVQFVRTRWRVQRSVALRAFAPKAGLNGAGLRAEAGRLRAAYGQFLTDHSAALTSHILNRAAASTRVRPPADREAYAAWRIRQTRYCRQAFRWQPAGPLHCNMAACCPYCWARSAGAVWDAVAALLFPASPAGTHPSRAAYDLVETSRTYVHDRNLAAFIRERLGEGKTPPAIVISRKGEIEALNHAAAYEVLTVRPTMVDGRPRMTSTIRQLFAVPAGATLGAHPAAPLVAAPRVSRYAAPTPAKAASLVAAMCRYPREIVRRPKGMTLEQHQQGFALYLEARNDRRLWSSFGGFRAGAKPRAVVMDGDPPKKRGRPRKSAGGAAAAATLSEGDDGWIM